MVDAIILVNNPRECWMEEMELESTRSQYSMIDQSIEISSVSSRNRNCKYFVRRPINGINMIGRRKDRDPGEFSGFYSPVQKQEMMLKKSLIEKAIGKSPQSKVVISDKKQNNTAETSESEKSSISSLQQNRMKSEKNLENIFKKKKVVVEESFSAREVNKNKENPEVANQQLEHLRVENERLKREIQVLVEKRRENEGEVLQFDLLKEYIKQIQVKLEASENQNIFLTAELRDIRSSNSSIDALESIHLQTIRSLNELNLSLKREVVELQEKMKYAGIEILMLKMKCPDESMSKIIEERINLKQRNRELKGEITKLKARLVEAELFQLTPENTARDYR